jgi:hypothetical protein
MARQTARNTTPGGYDSEIRQMPPLGTFEVNGPALALLAKWIKAMPAIPAEGWEGPAALAEAKRTPRAPLLQGRILKVPDESGTDGRATMTGIDGRAVALRPLGQGVYAIPADAPRGVYLIRVGARNFRRHLL